MEGVNPLLLPPDALAVTGAVVDADGEAAGWETPARSARTFGELIAALWLTAMMSVTSESSSRASTSSMAGFQLREIRRPIDSSLSFWAVPALEPATTRNSLVSKRSTAQQGWL